MTSLPDWLVERAALDEVPPASRDRVDRADPRELAERVAALREDSAAELARHPVGPAVAQIEAQRAAQATLRARRQRQRRLGALGLATTAATALVFTRLAVDPATEPSDPARTSKVAPPDDGNRVKGVPRLVAFRQVGNQAERLARDAFVRAGDVLQLRYDAGTRGYGVIASLDGAGVVTLHFPLGEDAPPEATAVAPKMTTLPRAYALDDAPRFERFFFLTADEPIDVQRSLAAMRALAARPDSADAALELPADIHQWSLRLRKINRASPAGARPRSAAPPDEGAVPSPSHESP